ncbi:dihydroorotate dehydrogenase 2, partial [Candidatus Thiomargarita nelsonii]
AAQALINRMGFNNQGIDRLLENVQKARFDGILGINIGKNFDTPLEKVPFERANFLPSFYIPHFKCVIPTPREGSATVGRKHH